MHSNLLRFTETETPRIQRYPKFYKPNILIHDLLHQNTHVCSQATTQLVVAYNFGFVHGSEGEGTLRMRMKCTCVPVSMSHTRMV